MARKRHSDEDCLRLLQEIEVHLSGGSDVGAACRAVGISDATYYNWKKKYGGMDASEIKRLKELEQENTKLKRMYADLALENRAMRDAIEKKL